MSKMEGSYLVPGAVAPGILNSAGFGGFVPSWDHWDLVVGSCHGKKLNVKYT